MFTLISDSLLIEKMFRIKSIKLDYKLGLNIMNTLYDCNS